MTLDVSETLVTIRLEGELAIGAAAEIKSIFVEALVLGKTLGVSLEGAVEADVTILQLLYAAGQEAARRGLGFEMVGPVPDSVRAAADEAGLATILPFLHSKS